MNKIERIACVTGASGMIGDRIIRKLLCEGYRARVLSRNKTFDVSGTELFTGGLENEDILASFLSGAHLLFQCAAELKDETKMWDVNVLGTKRLLKFAEKSCLRYVCYLSSAGVVGKTNLAWVNEEAPCNPQNTYEKTKWEAEKLVAHGLVGCRVVILRPTNVIDEKQPGVLALGLSRSFLNRVKVFIKGGECAHIIHVDDVASAALYFVFSNFNSPQCFIVSTDHEPLNTYGDLWNLCKAISICSREGSTEPVLHLPVIIPHLVRLLRRGKSVRGDVRYSSEKLLSTGFRYSLRVEEAVRCIAETQRPMNT